MHQRILSVWGATLCALLLLPACSNVPRYYLRMAEPDATLTKVTSQPEYYDRKVVLLGGALTEEESADGYVMLRLRNRPLDQDYIPHRPPSFDGPEAGSYWIMVEKGQLPATYRQWARMTIVGRVIGRQRSEPLLSLIYVRGWGISGKHDGVWSHVDPNHIPTVPLGIGNPR